MPVKRSSTPSWAQLDGRKDEEDEGEDGDENGFEALEKEKAKSLVADSRKDAGSSFANRAKFAEVQAARRPGVFGFQPISPASDERRSACSITSRGWSGPCSSTAKNSAKLTSPNSTPPPSRASSARVYHDAMAVAANPAALCGPGSMREVYKTDNTGRTITEYYGDPRSWMDDFTPPVERRLVKINTTARSRGED